VEEEQKKKMKDDMKVAIIKFGEVVKKYEESKGVLTLDQKQEMMSELAKCEADAASILQDIEPDEAINVRIMIITYRMRLKNCAKEVH